MLIPDNSLSESYYSKNLVARLEIFSYISFTSSDEVLFVVRVGDAGAGSDDWIRLFDGCRSLGSFQRIELPSAE